MTTFVSSQRRLEVAEVLGVSTNSSRETALQEPTNTQKESAGGVLGVFTHRVRGLSEQQKCRRYIGILRLISRHSSWLKIKGVSN